MDTRERPPANVPLEAMATCPKGQQATGGGVSVLASGGVNRDRVHTLESGPVPGAIPPTEWLGRIASTVASNGPGSLTLTVYVLCVPAP